MLFKILIHNFTNESVCTFGYEFFIILFDMLELGRLRDKDGDEEFLVSW